MSVATQLGEALGKVRACRLLAEAAGIRYDALRECEILIEALESDTVEACSEHNLPLIDGRCPQCRDLQGNTFVLDMQSKVLIKREARGLQEFHCPACGAAVAGMIGLVLVCGKCSAQFKVFDERRSAAETIPDGAVRGGAMGRGTF